MFVASKLNRLVIQAGSSTGIMGFCRDNGKSNGNYYNIKGVYRDNGKMEATII